jgi:hypothetical protein
VPQPFVATKMAGVLVMPKTRKEDK